MWQRENFLHFTCRSALKLYSMINFLQLLFFLIIIFNCNMSIFFLRMTRNSYPEQPQIIFCCCIFPFFRRRRERMKLLNIKVQYTPVNRQKGIESALCTAQYSFFFCICSLFAKNTLWWPESHIFIHFSLNSHITDMKAFSLTQFLPKSIILNFLSLGKFITHTMITNEFSSNTSEFLSLTFLYEMCVV